MDPVRNIKNSDFFKQTSNLERISFLLKYAILAPSYYNSQPWLFKINEKMCSFYLDPSIQLKEGDPDSQSLYISIGCAIENTVIAARYFNVLEKVESIFDGGKYVSTEISFIFKNQSSGLEDNNILDKEYEKLVDFIQLRRNSSGPFKDEPIPADIISRLSMLAFLDDFNGLRSDFIINKEQILSLSKIALSGVKKRFASGAYRKELSSWIRGNHSSKLDGLPRRILNLPYFFSAIIYYLMPFVNFGSVFSNIEVRNIKSAPVVCVIGGKEEKIPVLTDDSAVKIKTKPEIWVGVGRLTQRLLLEFSARGYNTSISNAATGSGELYREVQKIIGMTERPEIMFCIGHVSGGQNYTKRYDVKNKIKPTA